MDNAKMRQVRLNELTTKKEVLRLVKDSRSILVVNAERLMDEIMGLQEADAVPVVRCKDCKHRIYSYITGGTYYCEFDCYYRNETARDANNPDYFCASGERKDGDADGKVR